MLKMGVLRIYAAGFLVLLMGLQGLALKETNCPLKSVKDSILLRFQDLTCPFDGIQSSSYLPAVIQGDELSLQRALNMIHRNTHDYVALLFYASWCPFSRSFKPKFSTLSSLYPSIPHFAIEESAVKPSTLSKYGVHGFPTLFLLNSTMRMRYHGSRTLDSVVEFYGGITGFQSASVDGTSLGKSGCSSNHLKLHGSDQESCPFSWARSPENLLQQETYLALAAAFVLMRVLYMIFPALRAIAQFGWERCILNIRIRSLWELPLLYLNRAVQLCNSLNEPCKRSNLQEGAMNAKAWASKSLASVSFGESSTSRVVPASVRCRVLTRNLHLAHISPAALFPLHQSSGPEYKYVKRLDQTSVHCRVLTRNLHLTHTSPAVLFPLHQSSGLEHKYVKHLDQASVRGRVLTRDLRLTYTSQTVLFPLHQSSGAEHNL